MGQNLRRVTFYLFSSDNLIWLSGTAFRYFFQIRINGNPVPAYVIVVKTVNKGAVRIARLRIIRADSFQHFSQNCCVENTSIVHLIFHFLPNKIFFWKIEGNLWAVLEINKLDSNRERKLKTELKLRIHVFNLMFNRTVVRTYSSWISCFCIGIYCTSPCRIWHMAELNSHMRYSDVPGFPPESCPVRNVNKIIIDSSYKHDTDKSVRRHQLFTAPSFVVNKPLARFPFRIRSK